MNLVLATPHLVRAQLRSVRLASSPFVASVPAVNLRVNTIVDGSASDDLIVVFVHGAMDRGSSFDRVRGRMRAYHTASFDRRGYSGSVALPFTNDPFADNVSDLRTIVESLAYARVVLVGHSAGTNVCAAVAAESRNDKIVGFVGFEPPMPWTEWWPTNAGGSTLDVFHAAGPAAAAESFMRRIVGDSIWERLPNGTKEARKSEGLALVADLTTLRGRSPQFDAHEIRVPTVIGRGALSLPHQRRASETMASLIPGAELVDLVGQQHGAHLSDPDAFVALITTVISRLDPAPA